jgi:hypothetical protein
VNVRQARSARFLVWCALLLLALRPVAPVQLAVQWLTAPLRLAAELAAPLRIFERRSLLAAERDLASTAPDEVRLSVALKRDLQRRAEPSDPNLRQGRTLVGGEVRGRDASSEDRILVQLSDITGIVPGLPVVCGNAYVGRVLDVLADPTPTGLDSPVPTWGTALVELVTAAGFHIGASVAGAGADGGPVYSTVGGLYVSSERRPRAEDARFLALHNPSDRKLLKGLVCVDELFDDTETFSQLSRGFILGNAERVPDGGWRVQPRIDYEDGLFYVVILVPEDARGGVEEPGSLSSRASWKRARALVGSDPSPWREAGVINAGSLAGVEVGAAVTAIGQRLVGRISAVGPTSARVAFVGDPGFQVVAVARVPDFSEPLVLGRLVSIGRDKQTGQVLLRWLSRVEQSLPGSGSHVEAQLFTGSGDPGLESGFYLGEATLPRAEEGPLIVRLEGDFAPHLLRTLYVRIESARGEFEPR